VLSGGENDPAKGDHSLFPDRFADNGKSLLPDLAFRGEVVRAVEIQFVDFFLRDE
jgi:hypothetical protein